MLRCYLGKQSDSSLFPDSAYQRLADFRFHLRQFIHFSEEAARREGVEPQQHQLLLTIRGIPEQTLPSVTAISERMLLRHHSTVELIDRSVNAGLVKRRQGEDDRRQVFIELTPKGDRVLRSLTALHWEELRETGPLIADALSALVARARR